MDLDADLARLNRTPAFYVATTVTNWRAARVWQQRMVTLGGRITFDWTKYGEEREQYIGHPLEVYLVAQLHTDAELGALAIREVDGVRSADGLVVLWPGGCGTHVEIGVALAGRKPVFVREPAHTNLPALVKFGTASFHHDASITHAITSADGAVDPLRLWFGAVVAALVETDCPRPWRVKEILDEHHPPR